MNKTALTSFTILCCLSTVVLTGLAFSIQPVKASGTIYIRSDGSVAPSDTPISTVDKVTYTFTDNINDSIVVERDNIVVDGADYTLRGAGSGTGISLSGRSNVTIKNANIKNFNIGVVLDYSSNNMVSGNNITNSNWYGVFLNHSPNNMVSRNNIANNLEGVRLYSSSNNNITGNNITNNDRDCGVDLLYSSNNNITGNNITNNWDGVRLRYSSNNMVSGNNITNSNWYGVFLDDSSNNNIFYHNNFIDNIHQVNGSYLMNVWDDGYPSGGNYWSDYEDRYPDANELDNSGVWDTPYVIDESNQDNYPLVHIIPEFPSFLILPLFMIATLLAVIVYRKKTDKSQELQGLHRN